MDYSVVGSALQMVLGLGAPILFAIFAGALLGGILQTVTQIQDPVFGFFSRLVAAIAVLVLLGSYFFGQLSEFAARVWGGMDFYR